MLTLHLIHGIRWIYLIVTQNESDKKMIIKVEIKNNFGNEAIYPACEHSQIFAEIAGTKTLTRDTIAKIKALGYQIQQHVETEDL